MPRTIRFIALTLINYTSIRVMTVNYADVTKLFGSNGKGKTSIGTAPVWVLYGVDLLGKTFNPSPTNYEFDRVFASLLLSIDGTQYKFAREIDEKGKNGFYINDVPTKAKEYDALVASMFDKEMFLSLYNPSYFFTQHKDKQRDMIMRYVTAPASSEVFKQMSETESKPLAELFKKHDIEKAKALHTDLKNKNDKLHVQSQGSVKTLTEQLEELGQPEAIDLEAIEINVKELQKKIESFDADRRKVVDRESEIRNKQNQIDSLTVRIEEGKVAYDKAKSALESFQAETIELNCMACGQELTAEGKAKAEETKANQAKEKQAAVKAQAERVNPLIQQRKAIRSELETLKPLNEPESVAELIEKRNALEKKIDKFYDHKHMTKRLADAKQSEIDYLKAKNDSIFILDAIKAFKHQEATMQTEKVQALFTTLSIRLFKYVKTNDEWVSDFMIQMNDKDYTQLSLGEKMAAGLELQDVLYKQSELVVPCFVDNIESYTGAVKVFGQAITGRVVENQELKIETEGNA
jgi:DNA repair exonuclease SbcCD ATPase subunit